MSAIHCLECGYEGPDKTHTKGSFILQIVLFLCAIVPGIIYTFWRWTSGSVRVCRDCNGERIMPLDKWQKRLDKRV